VSSTGGATPLRLAYDEYATAVADSKSRDINDAFKPLSDAAAKAIYAYDELAPIPEETTRHWWTSTPTIPRWTRCARTPWNAGRANVTKWQAEVADRHHKAIKEASRAQVELGDDDDDDMRRRDWRPTRAPRGRSPRGPSEQPRESMPKTSRTCAGRRTGRSTTGNPETHPRLRTRSVARLSRVRRLSR
jgi:hypothetical protein